MKQSSTIISVIVAAVVLLSAFAIGLYIREVRQKNRAAESEAPAELETKQAEIRPRPPREGRRSSRSLSPQQRAQLREQIENTRQRWADMSKQERQEFRAKMLEIFDAKRREDRRRFETPPPEERDRLREEFMGMKKRWEDMSEEERQEFRDKMRERSNAIRQGND